MLIDVDVIDIEKMVIDFIYRFLIVGNVPGFRINIYIHAKNNVKIRRVIKIAKNVIIPSYFIIEIPIKMKEDNKPLINNRDYLFKLDHPNAYYYLVDVNFSFI